MKNKLIAAYLMIAVLYGVAAWLFGDYRYKSLPYNLGRGLVWPVSMLHSTPHIDASTPEAFGRSFARVADGHDGAGDQERFYNAFGRIAFYYYLQENPSITQADYGRMLSGPEGSMVMGARVMDSLMTKPQLFADVSSYVDGMSFASIVTSEKNIKKKTDELMASRPAGVQTAAASSPAPAPVPTPVAPAPQAAAPAPDQATSTPSAALPAAPAPEAALLPDVPPDTPVAPSFDCTKASTANEVSICRFPGLARKDLELSSKYKLLYAETTDKQSLKAAQTHWIKLRDICNGNDPCLGSAYDQRIREIDQQLQAPAH
jgi:hypothetical protein